jgi:hypothetical protein
VCNLVVEIFELIVMLLGRKYLGLGLQLDALRVQRLRHPTGGGWGLESREG